MAKKCSEVSVECIGNGNGKKYRCVVPATERSCPLKEGCPLRNEFFPLPEFRRFRKMLSTVMPPGTKVTYCYVVGVEEVEIADFTFCYRDGNGRRNPSLDCTYRICFSDGEIKDGVSPKLLTPIPYVPAGS